MRFPAPLERGFFVPTGDNFPFGEYSIWVLTFHFIRAIISILINRYIYIDYISLRQVIL